MDEMVSESASGQRQPKPDREQRDEAFSSGAGRKAIEVPKEEQEEQGRGAEGAPPVGLDLETKAEQIEDRLLGG